MKIGIIGAGICGLYLAKNLTEKGNAVTVFEKRDRIGKVACSGIFSERIFKFIPESQALVENRIENALIHFPKKTIKTRFSKPFFAMDHSVLDNLLFGLAENSGAKIILSRPADLDVEGFDRIIGCDGALSQTRKGLRLKEPKFKVGIQGFVSEVDLSDFVETWPLKEGGFIWKIPRGKEIEYGIMAEPVLAPKIFKSFLTERKIQLERVASALIPQGLIIPENKLVTLCGDAAGLTKPWSGGGVVWALTAADILIKTFPDFIKYQKQVYRFFKPRIFLSKLAIKTVYSFGFKYPRLLPGSVKIESDFLL